MHKGWILLFYAIGCCVVALILSNIPNQFLTNIIKEFDSDITAKEATDLSQKHLQEPKGTGQDTVDFVMGITEGKERRKRLNK